MVTGEKPLAEEKPPTLFWSENKKVTFVALTIYSLFLISIVIILSKFHLTTVNHLILFKTNMSNKEFIKLIKDCKGIWKGIGVIISIIRYSPNFIINMLIYNVNICYFVIITHFSELILGNEKYYYSLF